MYKHHQINFHQFFQRILLNIFKHIITQKEMPMITVSIKQRKCFLDVQLEIVDFSLELSGQNCKTFQNHQTLPKSAEISFTI